MWPQKNMLSQHIPVQQSRFKRSGEQGEGMPWSGAKTAWHIWMFPKIGVPQNGWFVMENPIKVDDLGVALFLETPICSRL